MSQGKDKTAVVQAFGPLADNELVAMIERNGGMDTIDVANRFGLSSDDARRLLRRLEAAGLVRGKMSKFSWGAGSGGSVLRWEAVNRG